MPARSSAKADAAFLAQSRLPHCLAVIDDEYLHDSFSPKLTPLAALISLTLTDPFRSSGATDIPPADEARAPLLGAALLLVPRGRP
jgi:hypothetical protein